MKTRRRRFSMLHVGTFVFVLILLVLLIAPLFLTVDPNSTQPSNRLALPSMSNWMGTDRYGRDVFARVVTGGRTSFAIGLSVTLISVAIGSIIGLYSSYFRKLDNIVMRFVDALMAIPPILFAIALMSSFGASVSNVITALSIVYIPVTARMVRSNAIQVKEELYVKAAKTQGTSYHRLIWKHIFPNVVHILLVQASIIFAETIISEASLSFLGAGIPAPAPSWGSIIYEGKAVIFKGWWMTLYPAAAIFLSVFSLFLIGEGMRKKLSAKRVFYHSFFAKKRMLKDANARLDERLDARSEVGREK